MRTTHAPYSELQSLQDGVHSAIVVRSDAKTLWESLGKKYWYQLLSHVILGVDRLLGLLLDLYIFFFRVVKITFKMI